jgi:proteasome lid subunit RPN8/RPN11
MTIPLEIAQLSEHYPTMDMCAQAAEQSIRLVSFGHHEEWVGIILEKDGWYYYSQAQTQHQNARSQFHLAYSMQYRVVASYHTHPGIEEAARWFSTVDIKTAESVPMVSYILDEYDGSVHRFIPGTDHVTVTVDGERIALGTVLP